METKKYNYSNGQMVSALTQIVFLAVIFYAELFGGHVKNASWQMVAILFIPLLARLIYLINYYFIPTLANKTALELDDEKLRFYIKGFLKLQNMEPVIYWKNVRSIEYTSTRITGSIILFKMNNGDDDCGLSLKYISGNDADIYQTVTAYLEKFK